MHHSHLSLWQQLSSLGPLAWVLLGDVVIGIVAAGVWTFRDQNGRVNADAFCAMFRKMIEVNNTHRALKLAMARESPVCQLARIGLQARLAQGDLAQALQAAQPQVLQTARRGLMVGQIIGLSGLLSGALLGILGGAHGLELGFFVFFGWPVLLLAGLVVRNALRSRGLERELDQVANAVADL